MQNADIAQDKITLGGKVFTLMTSRNEIRHEVKRLAAEIERDTEGCTPVFLCVLNGAFVFAADLLRCIPKDCEVCFVRLASYEGTSSTGTVKNIMGLNMDVKGRDVIIIEDIIETGRTMQAMKKILAGHEAKSVNIATLVSKPAKLETNINIRYCGFKMKATDFIVGYGLDYNGLGRNLPDIYIAAD